MIPDDGNANEMMGEWSGGSFDPKAFDLDAINLELAKYARWSRPRLVAQELQIQGFSDS